MEIEPSMNIEELEEDIVGTAEAARSAGLRKTMMKAMKSFPGIDECMSYSEVFRLVRSLDYSVVVFDTAPTGHTLHLLALPSLMEKGLQQFINLKNSVRFYKFRFTF